MANQPKPSPKNGTQDQPNKLYIWIPTLLVLVGWAYLHFSDYFELRVDKRIDLKLQESIAKIDTKVQTTNDKLDKLGTQVATIEGELKILRTVMQPKTAVNAKQTSETLTTAKKSGTRFDPELITVAGKEFISAGVSSSDPGVWNAALAFLDYRSFLNSALAPATDKFASIDKELHTWKFQLNLRSLKPGDEFKYQLRTGKEVPAERAAVLEPIGSHLNASKKVGSEFLLVEGFSPGFKLDGMRLKNIILKDSKIIYEGGQIEMENVYFVNCTFEVSRRPNGHRFASTVLASASSTTFQAGG